MIQWSAISTELKGALAVAVLFAAVWVILKIGKGDVGGFTRILGSAVIGLFAVGIMLVIANPEAASAIVDKFIAK